MTQTKLIGDLEELYDRDEVDGRNVYVETLVHIALLLLLHLTSYSISFAILKSSILLKIALSSNSIPESSTNRQSPRSYYLFCPSRPPFHRH
jgi:hypothetical protein